MFICGGVVIEDIDDFNRLSLMLTAMKPADEQKDIAIQGFGLFGRVTDLMMLLLPIGILVVIRSKILMNERLIVQMIGMKHLKLKPKALFYSSLYLVFWIKRS